MAKNQSNCENAKKKSGGWGEGGRVGYEQRIEVIVKIAKKKKVEGVQSRGGVGVILDANDELKLL